MNYYFAQHGKALPKESDITRPLSQDGINETNTVADTLATNGIEISKIFHSGKLRAVQTAEIFANKLGTETVTLDHGMDPNDDVTSFANKLSKENNNAMYVGHLPHMQKVISYLLNKDELSHSVIFQNSAVVCIQMNDTAADILWYVTPSILKS